MTNCEICRVLTSDEGQEVIFSAEHWQVSLAPDQRYLGRAYVSALRHVASLSDLSLEEWSELRVVINEYERMVREAFGAVVFNWGCLLNNTFQTADPVPHVHWHVRPRYATPPCLNRVSYPDPNFGHHYDRTVNLHVAPDELNRIANRLRAS